MLALSFVLSVWLCDAHSSGINLLGDASIACDMDAAPTEWGCQTRVWNYSTTFSKPTRQFCLDANLNNQKFMWWAGAPITLVAGGNNNWSLRSGDANPALDPTYYVPGQWAGIYIRVTKFDQFYKGLLLYAKDSTGQKVGDWIVPFENSPSFASAANHLQICNQSVMHVNAEDKPYVSKFIFVAPPAGTGTITFSAMLKTGPPNPTDWGNFYRLPPLTLTEGKAPTGTGKWVALTGTQSCAQYCTSASQQACEAVSLGTSMEGLLPNPLDYIYPCHSAVFEDCQGDPGVNLTNPFQFCSFHPPGCTSGASCTDTPSAAQDLFCLCGPPITGAPTAPPTVPTPSVSPASRLAPSAALLFLSLFFSSSSWVSFSLLFLSALPFATAHNWIEGTRGRAAPLGANQFCSPTFPQVNRNRIHMQAGQNQSVVVEWAAAHGAETYFVIIPDSARANIPLLTTQLMDGWLKGCPGGGFANTTGNQKYHRFRPNQNLASKSLVNAQVPTSATYAATFLPGNIWSGPVWNSLNQNGQRPAAFFNHPSYLNYQSTSSPDVILPFNASAYPSTSLAEYLPAYTVNDRRCSYVNASYPWIETIHRYAHSDVLLAMATATISFPARAGIGRYQLLYFWASYCDVMDVDVRAAPVAEPYGTIINQTNVAYDIGQHCYFPYPRQVGQCLEIVTDSSQCAALCSSDPACQAYQVFPLQLDSSMGNAYGEFPQSSYIPWDRTNSSWCVSSQFANARKQGSMVCFPIYQFQDSFNSARPLWTFTNDLDHQGFYGTCYIKPRAVSFLPFPQVPVDVDTSYRFFSKCIPCDNVGQNLSDPRWGPQQEYCTDCSKYPAAPKSTYTVPAWTQVGTGTFQAGTATWLSPAGTPYAFADECAWLAANNPNCSKFVMFSQTRANLLSLRTMDVNTSSGGMYRLTSSSFGTHYTPFSLSFPYYQNCACLNAASAAGLTGNPTLDVNSTIACEGTNTGQCVNTGFVVYQLS